MLYVIQDTDDFLTSYDAIIEYVKDRDNWPEMEDELRSRGVRCDLTFRTFTYCLSS